MNLQYRIDLLIRLGEYILNNEPSWQEAKEKASRENGWFIPSFVELSTNHIAHAFLAKGPLEKWVGQYHLPSINPSPKKVGIVMAGNVPLVGFHDLLAVFVSGHIAMIKTSSKDEVLIKHLIAKLIEWEPGAEQLIQYGEMLKGCDAYIATGSNNSAGYFEYYFKKYPHIIRRNRTSVGVLTGNETMEELAKLADDVYLYFGLGCRNVTKIYVPEGYDFIPLLTAFKKYDELADHHKYKNNYDYNLAILLLNKRYYMSNPSLLVVEDVSLFSPISQLNYEFYRPGDNLTDTLKKHPQLQCIVGKGFVPFGQSQFPGLANYADGVDTLQFLSQL
jgi:hypothetical protein